MVPDHQFERTEIETHLDEVDEWIDDKINFKYHKIAMKKLFMIILIWLFISPVLGGNISVNNVPTINTQCNQAESLNVYYYLDNATNSISRNPYDTFWNTIDSLVSVTSNVDIWRNNGILTSCNDWSRVSNVVAANTPALAIQNYDSCIFNKPSVPKYNNPNQIDAQIHFNIKYAKIFPSATNTVTSKFYHRQYWQSNWTCYPWWNVVPSFNSCPDVTVKYGIMNSHIGECLNYRIFWCGDWLLNRPGWFTSYHNWTFTEQCDPNDPTQQGWGNWGCNLECQPINIQAPTCSLNAINMGNGSYNINWNIVGTFNPTQINITPTLVNPASHNVNTNVWTWSNIVPTGYGNFTATMTVSNTAWSNTCQTNFFVQKPLSKICGDGNLDWPNDAWVYEQCDPGMMNFGNGCDTNCQLMTPSCVLSANQSFQLLWNPFTFSAITDIWATYTSFNLWNNNIIYPNNIIFPYNYTYNSIWNYNPTLTVQNNYPNIYPWVTRPTATCDTNVEIVNTCNITVNPSTIYLWDTAQVSWTIWPTFNIPAYMYISPILVGPWPHVLSTSTWHTYVGPNIVNTWQYVFNINSHTIYWDPFSCTGFLNVLDPLPVCGDGIINGNEECDSGWVPNLGCDSNCKLLIPSCTLTVNNNMPSLWNPSIFNGTTNSWADFYSLNFGPSIIYTGNINFPYTYTYLNTWSYSPSLVVENNYAPIASGVTRPTAVCNVALNIVAGQLQINKILITTGNLLVWDFVDYIVELTNVGQWVFTNAYITDILPPSLELISHNIVWVYPYNVLQWQDIYGNWFLEYDSFDINPWQTIQLNIRWQIRPGASSNQTTNCAFTSWDYDCVIYSLWADPYILKTQMMSNNGISTPFTTNNIMVSEWDYITYVLEFANLWWWNTVWWVSIIDHMPLCIDYVSASIHGVQNANFVQSQDIYGRWILEYNWFNLLAGQTWYVIVTGQVINSSSCTSYTNDSYIYFYNPINIANSSTTAIKSNKSVVVLTKDSNIHSHFPWDDKLFVVQVQNLWPNPISNITLNDIRPAGNCINYLSWTWSSFVKDPLSLTWTYNQTLMPGNTLWLYMSGNIANNSNCVNPNYQNIINLEYVELGILHKDQAVYNFAVIESPVANILLSKSVNKIKVQSGDNITYTIKYQNVWNTVINSYVITDYWPGMISFVSASPGPSNMVNLSTGYVLTWSFYTPLNPGQTWEIILNGIVQ